MAGAPCGSANGRRPRKTMGPLAALHIVARFAGTSPLPPPIGTPPLPDPLVLPDRLVPLSYPRALCPLCVTARADNGATVPVEEAIRMTGWQQASLSSRARTHAASPHAASVADALPCRTRPREAIHLRPLSGERGGWRSSASIPPLFVHEGSAYKTALDPQRGEACPYHL
jgi:hypothetical protein